MNHAIEAMGIASCDIRHLSCFDLLRRDRVRYGHNWGQRWAHESSQSKLSLEIPILLLKHLRIADESLHQNSREYFENFFQYGGELLFVCLFVCLFVYLFISLFVCLLACVVVCLFALFVC